MQFYIRVTDRNWFDFLRERRAEEVNFWRHYYALHGYKLRVLPEVFGDPPPPEFVEWHNTHVFRP